MLQRIIQGALTRGSLTEQIQREIEEKQLQLPLDVTYVSDDGEVPAKVVRLLRPYFIIEVGPKRWPVKVDYTGEAVGTKRRIPKKREPAFPREFNPGVFGKDLQIVRVLSGRSANA